MLMWVHNGILRRCLCSMMFVKHITMQINRYTPQSTGTEVTSHSGEAIIWSAALILLFFTSSPLKQPPVAGWEEGLARNCSVRDDTHSSKAVEWRKAFKQWSNLKTWKQNWDIVYTMFACTDHYLYSQDKILTLNI